MTVLNAPFAENTATFLMQSFGKLQEYESGIDLILSDLDCTAREVEEFIECVDPIKAEFTEKYIELFEEFSDGEYGRNPELYGRICDLDFEVAQRLNSCTGICAVVDDFDCDDFPSNEFIEAECDYTVEDFCLARYGKAIKNRYKDNAAVAAKSTVAISVVVTLAAVYLF